MMLSLFLTLLSANILAIILLVLFVWLFSLAKNDASVIDLYWGVSFAIIALLSVYLISQAQPFTPYLILLTALPVIWAVRYTVYIWRRNIGHGEDKRYTAMRKEIPASQWPLHCLFRVYGFQAIAMLVVALPIILGLASGAANDTKISILVLIGSGLWLAGVLIEAIGDYQLANFIKRRKKLGSEITGKIMDKGLWKYTRHPNYLGNAIIWWGIYLVACATPWGFLSLIGPLFMNFALVKVSGADHLESTLSKRPEYMQYMKRTPKFIPRFNRSTRK